MLYVCPKNSVAPTSDFTSTICASTSSYVVCGIPIVLPTPAGVPAKIHAKPNASQLIGPRGLSSRCEPGPYGLPGSASRLVSIDGGCGNGSGSWNWNGKSPIGFRQDPLYALRIQAASPARFARLQPPPTHAAPALPDHQGELRCGVPTAAATRSSSALMAASCSATPVAGPSRFARAPVALKNPTAENTVSLTRMNPA